jgi:VCBS repeat-containing protein
MTVTAVNDPPVANADMASVAEDGNVDVPVLANDTDVDNDTLTVSAVTQGTHGTVSINPDNTVKYTPAANYNGSDSFTYTVSDGNGGTATATVTVTITAVNDAPVANADTTSVAEDGTVNVVVLTNDTDADNDTLNVTSVTQGAHGAVVINPDKTVKYTPAANYNGSDSFTYTVSDGNGGTSTATVTVTVTAVNDAPVANADTASVAEDGNVNVAVLANDTDLENNTLTVTAVTQGTHGGVVINPDKTVKYTPAANYNGSDSFTYTISDGNGGTSTATVTMTVTSVNDSPVANADTGSVAEDGAVNVTVLANDTDPENNTLSVASVTQGAHGTVSINPDKTVRYAPALNYNGSDSFTYTISDGNGGTATATVTMTVTPVNDVPVAVNDTATVAAGSAVTIPVRANDTDVDGPSLTVTAVTQGARGSVTINAGQTVTYTATLSPGTDDTFTYTVSDGAGGTSTATVSVTLTAPPRVTTGLQVRYNFNKGSGSTVNDTSGVGTPLNLTISPTSAVTWLSGALSVNSATVISSAGAATKVIDAVRTSSAITVEAWVAADNLTQTGPARIVSINKNGAQSNIIFGQSANRYETQTSTASGTRTQQTPVNSASTSLKHVVYTRNSSGLTMTYIDGVQVISATATGSMSNWDTTMRLALANAIGGGKPWVGDLHLVAIYSRSLTATEVQQNFLAGASGN